MKKVFGGLYLCLFSNGTLKVGRAGNIEGRLKTHAATAECFGIEVQRTASLPFFNPTRAEKTLIDWCSNKAKGRTSREWFTGISFDECLAYLSDLQSCDMGPHPLPAANLEADLLFDRLYSLGKGRLATAYIHGRRKLLAIPDASLLVPSLDQLHFKCEAIRLAEKSGGTAPEWFKKLNCFSDWEEEIFFFDIANPDFELFGAIDVAVGEM